MHAEVDFCASPAVRMCVVRGSNVPYQRSGKVIDRSIYDGNEHYPEPMWRNTEDKPRINIANNEIRSTGLDWWQTSVFITLVIIEIQGVLEKVAFVLGSTDIDWGGMKTSSFVIP